MVGTGSNSNPYEAQINDINEFVYRLSRLEDKQLLECLDDEMERGWNRPRGNLPQWQPVTDRLTDILSNLCRRLKSSDAAYRTMKPVEASAEDRADLRVAIDFCTFIREFCFKTSDNTYFYPYIVSSLGVSDLSLNVCALRHIMKFIATMEDSSELVLIVTVAKFWVSQIPDTSFAEYLIGGPEEPFQVVAPPHLGLNLEGKAYPGYLTQVYESLTSKGPVEKESLRKLMSELTVALNERTVNGREQIITLACLSFGILSQMMSQQELNRTGIDLDAVLQKVASLAKAGNEVPCGVKIIALEVIESYFRRLTSREAIVARYNAPVARYIRILSLTDLIPDALTRSDGIEEMYTIQCIRSVAYPVRTTLVSAGVIPHCIHLLLDYPDDYAFMAQKSAVAQLIYHLAMSSPTAFDTVLEPEKIASQLAESFARQYKKVKSEKSMQLQPDLCDVDYTIPYHRHTYILTLLTIFLQMESTRQTNSIGQLFNPGKIHITGLNFAKNCAKALGANVSGYCADIIDPYRYYVSDTAEFDALALKTIPALLSSGPTLVPAALGVIKLIAEKIPAQEKQTLLNKTLRVMERAPFQGKHRILTLVDSRDFAFSGEDDWIPGHALRMTQKLATMVKSSHSSMRLFDRPTLREELTGVLQSLPDYLLNFLSFNVSVEFQTRHKDKLTRIYETLLDIVTVITREMVWLQSTILETPAMGELLQEVSWLTIKRIPVETVTAAYIETLSMFSNWAHYARREDLYENQPQMAEYGHIVLLWQALWGGNHEQQKIMCEVLSTKYNVHKDIVVPSGMILMEVLRRNLPLDWTEALYVVDKKWRGSDGVAKVVCDLMTQLRVRFYEVWYEWASTSSVDVTRKQDRLSQILNHTLNHRVSRNINLAKSVYDNLVRGTPGFLGEVLKVFNVSDDSYNTYGHQRLCIFFFMEFYLTGVEESEWLLPDKNLVYPLGIDGSDIRAKDTEYELLDDFLMQVLFSHQLSPALVPMILQLLVSCRFCGSARRAQKLARLLVTTDTLNFTVAAPLIRYFSKRPGPFEYEKSAMKSRPTDAASYVDLQLLRSLIIRGTSVLYINPKKPMTSGFLRLTTELLVEMMRDDDTSCAKQLCLIWAQNLKDISARKPDDNDSLEMYLKLSTWLVLFFARFDRDHQLPREDSVELLYRSTIDSALKLTGVEKISRTDLQLLIQLVCSVCWYSSRWLEYVIKSEFIFKAYHLLAKDYDQTTMKMLQMLVQLVTQSDLVLANMIIRRFHVVKSKDEFKEWVRPIAERSLSLIRPIFENRNVEAAHSTPKTVGKYQLAMWLGDFKAKIPHADLPPAVLEKFMRFFIDDVQNRLGSLDWSSCSLAIGLRVLRACVQTNSQSKQLVVVTPGFNAALLNYIISEGSEYFMALLDKPSSWSGFYHPLTSQRGTFHEAVYLLYELLMLSEDDPLGCLGQGDFGFQCCRRILDTVNKAAETLLAEAAAKGSPWSNKDSQKLLVLVEAFVLVLGPLSDESRGHQHIYKAAEATGLWKTILKGLRSLDYSMQYVIDRASVIVKYIELTTQSFSGYPTSTPDQGEPTKSSSEPAAKRGERDVTSSGPDENLSSESAEARRRLHRQRQRDELGVFRHSALGALESEGEASDDEEDDSDMELDGDQSDSESDSSLDSSSVIELELRPAVDWNDASGLSDRNDSEEDSEWQGSDDESTSLQEGSILLEIDDRHSSRSLNRSESDVSIMEMDDVDRVIDLSIDSLRRELIIRESPDLESIFGDDTDDSTSSGGDIEAQLDEALSASHTGAASDSDSDSDDCMIDGEIGELPPNVHVHNRPSNFVRNPKLSPVLHLPPRQIKDLPSPPWLELLVTSSLDNKVDGLFEGVHAGYMISKHPSMTEVYEKRPVSTRDKALDANATELLLELLCRRVSNEDIMRIGVQLLHVRSSLGDKIVGFLLDNILACIGHQHAGSSIHDRESSPTKLQHCLMCTQFFLDADSSWISGRHRSSGQPIVKIIKQAVRFVFGLQSKELKTTATNIVEKFGNTSKVNRYRDDYIDMALVVLTSQECNSSKFSAIVKCLIPLDSGEILAREATRVASIITPKLSTDQGRLLSSGIVADGARLLRLLTALDIIYRSNATKLQAAYSKMGLIEMWKQLEKSLSANGDGQYQTTMLPLVETLALVVSTTHKADEETKFIATTNQFLVSFCAEHRRMINQLLRNNLRLLRGNLGIIARDNHILDFDIKQAHFHKLLTHCKQLYSGNEATMVVNRKTILEDSFDKFLQLYDLNKRGEVLRAALSIKFEGEVGVDEGGLSREWLELLSKEVLSPDYCLFIPTVPGAAIYQVNPMSHINFENHLEYFFFVGMILGRAMFDKRTVGCYFSRVFYKTLLRRPVSLADMETIDENYYKSLLWMLENDITDVISETFSVTSSEFGKAKVTELIPGGASIAVTEENKHDFVQRVVEYKLVTCVKPQLENLARGFHRFIPYAWIEFFDENELELLISGLPTIDVDDWQENTDYVGYVRSSPQIVWFWQVVREDFGQEEKAKLLQFVTGTSKVPVHGFAHLESNGGPGKFSIHKDMGTRDRLPSSHTCSNQLMLPQYADREALKRALFKAITEGHQGFGFA